MSKCKTIHLVMEIKVTYLDKRYIILAAEIIVKATLALISAFPYFTSRDYLYLTNQSTFDFLSTCLKLKKALPIRLYKTAGNCNVILINVNILSCPSAKRYI